MNLIGIITGVIVWLFVDVYLGIKIRNIKNAKQSRSAKFALIMLNVLLGIIAIFVAINLIDIC